MYITCRPRKGERLLPEIWSVTVEHWPDPWKKVLKSSSKTNRVFTSKRNIEKYFTTLNVHKIISHPRRTFCASKIVLQYNVRASEYWLDPRDRQPGLLSPIKLIQRLGKSADKSCLSTSQAFFYEWANVRRTYCEFMSESAALARRRFLD